MIIQENLGYLFNISTTFYILLFYPDQYFKIKHPVSK